MLMRTVLHNSVSLDGSFVNFTVDMGLHYQVVGMYQPEIYLVGSNTAKTGIEMYHPTIPKEEPDDHQKPERSKSLSIWAIPDSKGILQGMLHVYRRFDFCRDVIILVSRATSTHYLEYLSDRNYDYIQAGEDHVDYKKAFSLLQKDYHANTILADTGKTLGNVLLNQHLVNELSLLVHPTIAGFKSENLFSGVNTPLTLKLVKNEVINNDYLWISYQVSYQ
jgi:2,5-diamino-6-(ribosylamino)-4(3H)-pyrimidinone 5'-phosphate reductase